MNDEDNRTLYVGNLHGDVTEELLYELFLQAGPVQYVKIPIDKSTKKIKSFGFVCFKDDVSVPYGFYLLDNIRLLGKNIRVQPRNRNLELPPVHCVGIHTLGEEIGTNDNSTAFSNLASNLPPQFQLNPNLLPHNLNFPGNNFGNIHGTSAGFPFTPPQLKNQEIFLISPQGNSQSGYPYTPPSLPSRRSFRTPTVDTDYLNNFKNMRDNRDNRYENKDQNNYRNRNDSNQNNRRDSYDRDSEVNSRRSPYDSGRRGFRNGDSKSRLSGRLEFPNNQNYNHNERYDGGDGGSGYIRRNSDNRDFGEGNNRRNSYDSRNYQGDGGGNRRDSCNNNRRSSNDDNGTSSGRYYNSGPGHNDRYQYNQNRY